ncbi:MAG: 1,2-phenylacetyl-CoA epoxidase subunit PaaD [Gemmatimonadaceae bacterium]|nr:1,2-phenylacetyl-CoA epoxidase subunit PaaD [Gemmatimonadaceae bacterium]
MSSTVTKEAILEILSEVKDPELPMIDVVELGIVRDVVLDAEGIHVDVTPTYSGCPAMQVIEREIVYMLNSHGFENVTVHTIFSPPWTTDWLSEATRRKLRDHGIAPPYLAAQAGSDIGELVSLRRARPAVECPFCGSPNTEEKSEFGSTACKAIHYCNNCHQPFDHFKAF